MLVLFCNWAAAQCNTSFCIFFMSWACGFLAALSWHCTCCRRTGHGLFPILSRI